MAAELVAAERRGGSAAGRGMYGQGEGEHGASVDDEVRVAA